MNVQRTQIPNVKPNVKIPIDCWTDSVQIPHVPVNVTVQTLFNLIAQINVKKKERLWHWILQISLGV